MKTMTNEIALQFGLTVIEIVKKKALNPVRIRVVLDGDVVFQYMMEGKKGDEWLDRKQRTVERTHRSSLDVFNHSYDYKELLDDHRYAVCGGGYPIIIDGVYRGTFIVSGLEHTQNHQLIVDALKEMEENK